MALTLGLSLAGCGDPTKAYCSDLQQHNKQIADMIGSDTPAAALMARLPMLQGLADKAPQDLQDQWGTFLGALKGLDKALRDAGLKASDFTAGKPPAGLAEKDKQAVAAAAAQLSTDAVVQASSGIEQEARDVCKINLGLS